MEILKNIANVGAELPVVKTAETTSALPEINTQDALDDILAFHAQEEPLGLQFYPECCVHTLAVGEQVYVVDEYKAGTVAYPEGKFTYVVPDAHDRACRRMLAKHGITRPVESIQTQSNILEPDKRPSPMRTSSLVPAFKANKELLQRQGNCEWYEKLRDAQFLAEGPEFSIDKEKFNQILAGLKPEVQNQWTKLPLDFPARVPVHHKPAGQVSGRFSTHVPNLQGLPKVLRPAFYIEPKNTWYLIAADYRQIQPRILAGLSGDAEWKRPFEEGIDFYKHCASAMFDKPIEDISDDERAVSKRVCMGIVFHMGEDTMREEIEDLGSIDIDEAKAKKMRQDFSDKFSTLMAWRDSIPTSKYAGRIEGDSAHRTLILPSGRQIVYDAARFGRQPLCAHLAQGIEAEIVLNAILKFHEAVAKEAINARIVLVLHDELLVACHPNNASTVSGILSDCMTEAFNEYPKMLPAENIVKISEPSVYWGAKVDTQTQE